MIKTMPLVESVANLKKVGKRNRAAHSYVINTWIDDVFSSFCGVW